MRKKLLLIIFICLVLKSFAVNYSISTVKRNFNDKSPPVLFNFRVENTNKDRLYFDSTDSITATNTKGFIVSGNTISAITVNSGALTGHYFTVTSSFSFWDNNTIRYEGEATGNESDLASVSDKIHDFSLTYIENNIIEPSASTYRYVSPSANDEGDGTSEDNPWSLRQAFSNAAAGMTIWVKAGDYGNFVDLDTQSGTASEPIKFIGYKSTIGDITSMYYSYGDGALDNSEMPTSIETGSENAFIKLIAREYVIVKNFQVEGYSAGFYANNGNGIIFDNCIAKDNESRGYGFVTLGTASKNSRFLNGIAINGNATAWMLGNHSLIKNMKVYGNLDGNPDNTIANNVNYYYALSGDNNIVIDNYAERDGNLSHGGHGMSVHSINVTSTRYNLIENYTTENISKSVELRHSVIEYNVVRGLRNYGTQTGGVLIRDGAGYNVVENSILRATTGAGALQFVESVETGVGLGHDNIIRNNIITSDVYKNVSLITADSYTGGATGHNNKILNNTIYGAEILWNLSRVGNYSFTGCEFTNNIFHSVNYMDAQGGILSGWSFDYNNFYNGFDAIGTNYKTVNPNFEDAESGNFRLKSGSPMIEAGINLDGINYDFEGNARLQGTSITIGAFDKKKSNEPILLKLAIGLIAMILITLVIRKLAKRS